MRANELRQLTPYHLDQKRKGLILEAKWTKNRKAGFQPLPEWLFNQLVEYGKSGKAKQLYIENEVFRRTKKKLPIPENPLLYVPKHTARPLAEDLRKAGIEKETSEGIVDFHAIRTSYINLVIGTKCDLKTAQTLARHSTPQLTMNVYGRSDDAVLRNTVKKFGDILKQNTVYSDELINGISTESKTAEQLSRCPAVSCMVGITASRLNRSPRQSNLSYPLL